MQISLIPQIRFRGTRVAQWALRTHTGWQERGAEFVSVFSTFLFPLATGHHETCFFA